MSDLLVPIPKSAIAIRPGTLDDVPFLDSLQKLHTKQVGWMPTAQFEGKIKLGHVLVATETRASASVLNAPLPDGRGSEERSEERVGYVIGNDQYFKHDDIGIIYQLNVLPGKQRGFIGATLLKAMFDRAAYGCRLFCCWCAQDIAANYFWESMGFVPLAFRTGSRTKGKSGTPRVHIFWQKRIRSGDRETPYWFPSQTSSGAIREDRLVLPIPPGTRWNDVMPILLPQENPKLEARNPKQIGNPKPRTRKEHVPEIKRSVISSGGLRIVSPEEAARSLEKSKKEPREKTPREKTPRVKVKNDPRYVAAARELRDRWLEEVNSGRSLMTDAGKYDVSRMLPTPNDRQREVIGHVNPALPLPAPSIAPSPAPARIAA